MIEIGRRVSKQPAPPHAMFEALTEPNRDPARPWLVLLDDEVWPAMLVADAPSLVVWSSIWSRRPEAVLRFELQPDGSSGTNALWTLSVAEPEPDSSLVGHMRKRVNYLINGALRATFGQ
jgi:hypothetical protein